MMYNDVRVTSNISNVVLLGFKTELKLNNKQRSLLLQNSGVRRFAWNWGLSITKQILDHNAANPETKIKFPSGHTLAKWFVALVKPENTWLNDYSAHIPAECLHDLGEAWKRCFNKTAKAPRFKKKGKCSDSFTIRAPNGGIHIEPFSIRVPKVGVLKTYERLPQVKAKQVVISRHAHKWYVSFGIEVAESNEPKPLGTVGVDLGVARFATLSQGEYPDSPKPLRSLGRKISKLQYRNRNKKQGSSNWLKAQRKIAKLHKHIADVRSNYIHNLTSYLAKNHSEIVIEDLNVAGMMKNHGLAKAISDCGFHEFRFQLEYKTRLYGSTLTLADRWFPSSKICFCCGGKKESLKLSDRVFKCDCGQAVNRDLNAAINLSKLGVLRADVKPVDLEVSSPRDEAGSGHSKGIQLSLFADVS
jgi:putative transposase